MVNEGNSRLTSLTTIADPCQGCYDDLGELQNQLKKMAGQYEDLQGRYKIEEGHLQECTSDLMAQRTINLKQQYMIEDLRRELKDYQDRWLVDIKPVCYVLAIMAMITVSILVVPKICKVIYYSVCGLYGFIVSIPTLPRRFRNRVRVYLNRFTVDEDIQMEELIPPTPSPAINIAIKDGELVVPSSGSSESIFRLTRDNYQTFQQDVTFQKEAIQPGSPLVPVTTWPKFICKVYGVDKDDVSKINYLGLAFRAGHSDQDYLFTAYHVLDAAPGKIVRLMHPTDSSYTVEVEKDLFKILSIDVAVLEMTPVLSSKLNLSKATAPKCLLDGKMFANLYGRTNYTTGILRRDKESMGAVNYIGSSIKGFSGSPYVLNRSVYGLHIGSHSQAGFGYDIDYMLTAADKAFKVKIPKVVLPDGTEIDPENSEDYVLEEIVRRGKSVKYQNYGLDEIKLVYNGKMYILDREDIQKHNKLWDYLDTEAKWSDGIDLENFVDAEEPPQQVQRVTKNSISQGPVEVPGKRNHVEDAQSLVQLRQLEQQLSILRGQMEHLMAGLEQMRVQQSAALQFIPECSSPPEGPVTRPTKRKPKKALAPSSPTL